MTRGRPRAPTHAHMIVADRAAGLSWREIARMRGIGTATAMRALDFWDGLRTARGNDTHTDDGTSQRVE